MSLILTKSHDGHVEPEPTIDECMIIEPLPSKSLEENSEGELDPRLSGCPSPRLVRTRREYFLHIR
jgi:hypothetical protein